MQWRIAAGRQRKLHKSSWPGPPRGKPSSASPLAPPGPQGPRGWPPPVPPGLDEETGGQWEGQWEEGVFGRLGSQHAPGALPSQSSRSAGSAPLLSPRHATPRDASVPVCQCAVMMVTVLEAVTTTSWTSS